MQKEIKLKKQEIRKELKKLYPNIKFSIRSDWGTYLTFINVRYKSMDIYSPVINKTLRKLNTVKNTLDERDADTHYSGISIYVFNNDDSIIVENKAKEMNLDENLTKREREDTARRQLKSELNLY